MKFSSHFMMLCVVFLLTANSEGAMSQELIFPSGLTLDPAGMVVVADRAAHRVFSIDPITGAMRTIVGTGVLGFGGDGGPAVKALVQNPEWVEFDHEGNLFLADRGNHRIRRIDAETGIITTVVGNGEMQHSGDGGPSHLAGITNPFGLTLDSYDNLFVFDTEAHSIRRVDAATSVITTVIGSVTQGFSGDGGQATDATLYRPHNGVFDSQGRLVFGDSFNQRIRRWDASSGVIVTIAGTGEQGRSPPGTPATQAEFMFFGGMVYNASGDLIFTSLDSRILSIEANSQELQVVVGTGEQGFAGDGGPATSALINTPYGLAITPAGDLIFSDAGNKRIRRVDGRTGLIHTIAGGN